MSGPIVGVGIDLVDIHEFRRLLAVTDGAFLEAAWTAAELRRCAQQPGRLAVSWALKEAVMKAIGFGLGDVDPLDVEVDCTLRASPEVAIVGATAGAALRLGIGSWRLGCAVDRRWALATAVAMGGPVR